MKISRYARVIVAASLLFTAFAVRASAASEEAVAVRDAMSRAFALLRAGDYAALYDALPSASQKRISRERFTSGLQRATQNYGLELERLEIGAVRVGGDVAVVETVMYGRVHRPFEGEGKVVAQQYLVRENGQWRVATGDRAAVQPILARQPALARRYPVRDPHFYLKRDGRWVDVGSLGALRNRFGSK